MYHSTENSIAHSSVLAVTPGNVSSCWKMVYKIYLRTITIYSPTLPQEAVSIIIFTTTYNNLQSRVQCAIYRNQITMCLIVTKYSYTYIQFSHTTTIDLTEPVTTVTGTTTAKGTVVDAVIKLYTLDHSYKFISVSQVSINWNTIYFVLLSPDII